MTNELDDINTVADYPPNTKQLNQIGRPVKPKDSGLQLKIAKSARLGISFYMQYTKLNGQSGTYELQRYSFRNHKGRRLLYAWDLNDKQIKCFATQNIKSVQQLQIQHKRLWTIEMGNDPQQLQYWKNQKRKTAQQKRAEERNKKAKQLGQTISKDQLDKRKAMTDQIASGIDIDNIKLDMGKQVGPIVKTLSRGHKRTVVPRTTKGTIKPFGVV